MFDAKKQKMEKRRRHLLKKYLRRRDEETALCVYGGPEIHKKLLRLVFMPRGYCTHLFKKVFKKQDEAFLSMTEARLTHFLLKNLGGHDVFYDIGSHRGFYTKLAKNFCKEVHAFEPNPEVFKELEKMLEKVCFVTTRHWETKVVKHICTHSEAAVARAEALMSVCFKRKILVPRKQVGKNIMLQ